MKDRKKAKQYKMKIGVMSFVRAKIGEMEKTRKVESRRTRKELLGCVQESQ